MLRNTLFTLLLFSALALCQQEGYVVNGGFESGQFPPWVSSGGISIARGYQFHGKYIAQIQREISFSLTILSQIISQRVHEKNGSVLNMIRAGVVHTNIKYHQRL
jgi:hypothetical protein